MSNKESFKLNVETDTYKNRIRTRDVGVVDNRTRYGLEKISEALYISATECVKRHGQLALTDRKG